MALEITEFKNRMNDNYLGIDAFKRPPVMVQPGIPIGVSARSVPFHADTRFIIVRTTASCRIKVYAPPNGDATTVAADGSDGGEFFPAGEHVLGVSGGDKLAVVASVSA